jgi:hypothetical protein
VVGTNLKKPVKDSDGPGVINSIAEKAKSLQSFSSTSTKHNQSPRRVVVKAIYELGCSRFSNPLSFHRFQAALALARPML